MKLLVALSLVASIFLVDARAAAQTRSTTETAELEAEARARFQLGQLYYSQARFAEAAREFEGAYATHPHPLLLHNIYLARRDLGDLPGAIDALGRYLADATDLSASDRRLLEGRLGSMERQLAATPPATEPEPEAPVAPLDPVIGDARVDATETPVAELPSLPPPPATASTGIGIVPGAVVLGIAGAALVSAAIAGGVALGVQSERDAMCTLPNGDCPASVNQSDYGSRFSAARDAAWGLFAAGLATAAIGAVLLGVGIHGSSDTPTASAACDGTGCFASVTGRF